MVRIKVARGGITSTFGIWRGAILSDGEAELVVTVASDGGVRARWRRISRRVLAWSGWLVERGEGGDER